MMFVAISPATWQNRSTHLKLKITRSRVIVWALIAALLIVIVVEIPNHLPFPESKYMNLLTQLKNQGYTFITVNQLNASLAANPYGKYAILRHDVDFSFSGAKNLVAVEEKFGVKSTFFLRPDAYYYTQSISYFKGLQRQGWEIGFHYDCLSRSGGNKTLATTLFESQLTYMRFFFNISSTVAHGDTEYNIHILNEKLYNETVWSSNHVSDLYTLQNYSYIADTNHIWQQPSTLKNLVLVNLHADWWG